MARPAAGGVPAGDQGPSIDPQIVIWIEKPTGQYVDTIFITQQTGLYGIGNRPGRFDFNSGPNWPYGRRVFRSLTTLATRFTNG